MTIIKNHFEVFLVTSKNQGNGIIESKVGLYSWREKRLEMALIQISVPARENYRVIKGF
jgi:hypothetical protein